MCSKVYEGFLCHFTNHFSNISRICKCLVNQSSNAFPCNQASNVVHHMHGRLGVRKNFQRRERALEKDLTKTNNYFLNF